MGFFLGKTWPFWLLAVLLAVLIAWIIHSWWNGRRARGTDHESTRELEAARASLREREAELARLKEEHADQVAAFEGAAAPGTAQVAAPLAATVPLAEHQARVDDLDSQVAILRTRVRELEADAARVPGLQARIEDLQAEAGQVPDLRARIEELEGRLSAPEPAPVLDMAAASRLLGAPISADDLTAVEGIGPKISELCREAGIRTWRELASTPVERLKAMLDDAGPRYRVHDPQSWPKQAALLAAGDWDAFKQLTDRLKGGRAAE